MMADPPAQPKSSHCHGVFDCCAPDMNKPLLPKGCNDVDPKTDKKPKWKPACGNPCGSDVPVEGAEVHLMGCQSHDKSVLWNRKQQCCCLAMMFFFVYFVLFGIIQWICFHWATENCGALPDDYDYPGGGIGLDLTTNNTTGKEVNLLPKISLIVDREDSVYGQAFDVLKSNAAQITDENVGTWFRTWGPWFWTYTYQDTVHSKATVYMRPTIIGMSGAMTELAVHRCDGKGSVMKFSEGTNVIGNFFKELFQTNTGKTLAILVDGTRIATVEETFHGQKGAIFRSTNEATARQIASSILTGVNDNGFNQWFLKNKDDSPMPFYMTSAIAANMAFKIANNPPKKTPAPSSFAEQTRGFLKELITPAPQPVEHAVSQQSKDAERV